MATPDGTRTRQPGRAGPDHQLPPGDGDGARRTSGRQDQPGLGDLIRSLANDMGTLLRQEIDLAKMEARRAAGRLAADSAFIGVGVAIAAVGVLCLVLALALGLGALLGSYWLGTLITGVFLLLVGGGFFYKGLRDLRAGGLIPTNTTESLKEDARWARDEARDLKQGITRE